MADDGDEYLTEPARISWWRKAVASWERRAADAKFPGAEVYPSHVIYGGSSDLAKELNGIAWTSDDELLRPRRETMVAIIAEWEERLARWCADDRVRPIAITMWEDGMSVRDALEAAELLAAA